MVTITLYTRQQKRYRCIEQSFGLCGRGRGWMIWENGIETVHYHIWNESPVQVQCTILDTWGWCTGTTQRNCMGKEEGGGFRKGNTCIPVADSFWYMAKPIQYCKVKKEKKRKKIKIKRTKGTTWFGFPLTQKVGALFVFPISKNKNFVLPFALTKLFTMPWFLFL